MSSTHDIFPWPTNCCAMCKIYSLANAIVSTTTPLAFSRHTVMSWNRASSFLFRSEKNCCNVYPIRGLDINECVCNISLSACCLALTRSSVVAPTLSLQIFFACLGYYD